MAWGVRATDDFNRADESPIGGNWSRPGSVYKNLTLVSNTLQSTDTVAGGSGAYYSGRSWENDQYSQFVIVSYTGSYSYGPAVRFQSATSSGYFWYATFSNTYQMYRDDNGSGTALGSSYSVTTASGDTLKLRMEGTTLTPTRNGADQATRGPDATYGSGSPGVRMYGNIYGQVADTWEGGDNPSTGSPWYAYAQM